MVTGAGQRGRILIVDDEPMVRDALASALSAEGYVVDVAGDGVEALDRICTVVPDAILLDLLMSGMNGRQFLQNLRTQPAYAAVPVLIMTAVQGVEINLAAIGADDFVQKPFNVNELLNKVALAVYRSRDADNTGQVRIDPERSEPERAVADRGIVLVAERDRARLKRVDSLLSHRGYTVVAMTRAGSQLTRLANALKPVAVLLELSCEGATESFRDLRDLRVLLYGREAMSPRPKSGALAPATDAALVQFVEGAS